ncbi:MAG: cyclic nucleotide-binding domain-containing protein [Peptococcaceae bacterium]|nr:cyclic nucleotide-binding domain-containing protein [Peptococcaceae bacterium]
MSTDLIIKVLKKISFFEGVDNRTLTFLSRCAKLLRADKGTVLFNEGDLGDCMYIILNGKVRVYQSSKDGITQTLGVLTRSEPLGEMSLLDGLARSASAVVMEETILFCLSRHDFQIFLQSNFTAALKIIETLSLRLRTANERLAAAQTSTKDCETVQQVNAKP